MNQMMKNYPTQGEIVIDQLFPAQIDSRWTYL